MVTTLTQHRVSFGKSIIADTFAHSCWKRTQLLEECRWMIWKCLRSEICLFSEIQGWFCLDYFIWRYFQIWWLTCVFKQRLSPGLKCLTRTTLAGGPTGWSTTSSTTRLVHYYHHKTPNMFLLFYQTNYFVSALVIFFLIRLADNLLSLFQFCWSSRTVMSPQSQFDLPPFSSINPGKMLLGMITIGIGKF